MASSNLSKVNLAYHADYSKANIAVVVASWNTHITSNLAKGCIDTLQQFGVQNITKHTVPGCVELPLGAQWLAQQKKFDAIICIGCVIQGQTKHFAFVCNSCTNGIQEVALTYNLPVIFGVLTDNNEQQSIDRSGGKLGNKGIEAAATALDMIGLKNSLL